MISQSTSTEAAAGRNLMTDPDHRFYNEVYDKHDPTPKGPYGWIQWKGTDVCIDLHCACGYHGHVDTDFFYFYQCPSCKAKYAVGQNVALIPLSESILALYKKSAWNNGEEPNFVSCKLEKD
jgi:hypothetical protein